ncbi:NAD-dependent epimerase/dehydratase family protein [Chromobacterium paludis]|uniref:NAD-dependent epimerase/dehydratase family protein n=1 Tax=Chromobacterium paludis TaxID=2605945 RepID=A0A5C1DLY9_9NEIS|nr:NAD-dependent epimerase/dehydratase family protein [Chromobacterium paludis]QEL57701.1 NAD-dependent epimerase/dehydratase family protein [Chromobacterium paludis]
MSGVHSPLLLPVEDLDHVVDMIGVRWERLRGQKLLLTGGTGFIGKWLLATFLHANRQLGLSARVVALSRRPESFLQEFPELRGAPEIEWLTGDVRNLTPEIVGDCNFAIHAATDVVATSTQSEILDTCIVGTRRVLDAMLPGTAPRRLLLLSSGAVYGRTPSEVPAISESWSGAPDPLTSASAYGEGKRVSELLCAMAAAVRPGLEVAIARCFAFVGPHLPLDKHFAIGNFIGSAMRSEDIHIQGDGTPLRSYLYAADLVHWLWLMLFDAPSGRAYNVGGTESLSIGELAHRVNGVLGGKGKVRIAQTPPPGAVPQSYVPSVERIAIELGVVPTVSLDEAILRTALWAGQPLLK